MQPIGATFPQQAVEVFRSSQGRTVITSRLQDRGVNFYAQAMYLATQFKEWSVVDDPLGRKQAGRFRLGSAEIHFRYFTFIDSSLEWEVLSGEDGYRVLVIGLAGDI